MGVPLASSIEKDGLFHEINEPAVVEYHHLTMETTVFSIELTDPRNTSSMGIQHSKMEVLTVPYVWPYFLGIFFEI